MDWLDWRCLPPASGGLCACAVREPRRGFLWCAHQLESNWNLGWSFTANSNVDVVGLGNWDGEIFSRDQQIGLWNSTGNLLASDYDGK